MTGESDKEILLTANNATTVDPQMYNGAYPVDGTVGELYPEQQPHAIYESPTSQYYPSAKTAFAKQTVIYFRKGILVGFLLGFFLGVLGAFGGLVIGRRKRTSFFLGWLIGILGGAVIVLSIFLGIFSRGHYRILC